MTNFISNGISVYLDRPNLFYLAGETISGTVKLNITQGKVEEGEVYIRLTGEIGYTTVVYDFNSGLPVETVHHDVRFYTTTAFISKSKELIFDQSEYLCPFEIPLDNHLPPTFRQPESYPHVRYYLQVIISTLSYRLHKEERKYLTIYPRVNLLQNPQCSQSLMFGNHNRKKLGLNATIDKLIYIPGELIHIKLEISNPKEVLIKQIILSMSQLYQIGQTSDQSLILQTTLPNVVNLKKKQIIETFSTKIPTDAMPPSYKFLGEMDKYAIVKISYMLKLKVILKGILTNFDVDIPITIGTEPGLDHNHQQSLNLVIVSYSSNPEESIFIDHDLPPSYDSVMQNTK